MRHNHKPRIDDSGGDPATKIRGSGQFADVPDLLLELSRRDKRTNEAILSVSKFRHGSKPEDLSVWLDAVRLRLVSLPPVIDILRSGKVSRAELLVNLKARFGIEQRLADDFIREQQMFLRERMIGHKKTYEIDRDTAPDAPWYPNICRIPPCEEGVEDMQGCISSSVSSGAPNEASASASSPVASAGP